MIMRQKHFFFLTCTFLVILVIGISASKVYNHFGIMDERQPYSCTKHNDDTLRLSMIGDSWVFMHKQYDDSLASHLTRAAHRPSKVSSFGICGLTSKEVYRCINDNDEMRRLLKQGADYCFVSVGINDTNRKMGASYYARHTVFILRFLLRNGITPILLEIPDYDIRYTYKIQTYDRKLLRMLSMFITGSSVDCREEYRQALVQELERERLTHQVLMIPRHVFKRDHFTADRMHLNEEGYAVLDSCIMRYSAR